MIISGTRTNQKNENSLIGALFDGELFDAKEISFVLQKLITLEKIITPENSSKKKQFSLEAIVDELQCQQNSENDCIKLRTQ